MAKIVGATYQSLLKNCVDPHPKPLSHKGRGA